MGIWTATYSRRSITWTNGFVNEHVPANPLNFENFSCGTGRPLLVIAGPCVIENELLTLQIAGHLVEVCQRLGLPLIFKASFDKANRTSLQSYRGLGIQEGLAILDQVKRKHGVPVTTDVHLPEQATAVADVVQLIQIPAFLARQTDLLVAAAKTGRAVNVKKGQFMAPRDMRHVVDKLAGSGCDKILLTERGTFFGYGALVNDMTGIGTMQELGVPVVFDATHSVQRPSAANGQTGGDRRLVEPLARAAVAAGCDALFLQTHPNPDQSPSDGPNMVALDHVAPILNTLKLIRNLLIES